MKREGINKRVKELCDILKNYEQHKQFFAEIDRDIRKSLEREKKKQITALGKPTNILLEKLD